MRQLISWISIFLLAHEMSAQQHLQFQVKVDSRLGNESFIPGASVTIESDTILCSNLLVYLGGFILWNKGVEVAHWPLDYFLVYLS